MARGRRRRPQDHFGHRAKKEGFAARSVYKLQEIDRRARLLKGGLRVLDLGAAPGSWAQYVAKRVGPSGRVVAVDLQPAGVELPPWVEWHVADVNEVPADVLDPDGRGFDLVLSDMAPATTGHRGTDQIRSFQLFMAALAHAERHGARGGHFVGKIFQGGDFPEAQAAVRGLFDRARVLRPDAVRSESYEVYLVGLGRRARDDDRSGGAAGG